MKRGIIFFGVFFLLWAGLFATEGWAQTKPKKGGTITVGLNTDVTAVDPHVTTAFVTATVLNHVFEPLVGHRGEDGVGPGPGRALGGQLRL